MQKENTMTVGQWCGQWFTANRHKWNGNTEGGYRNLIYSHILPSIGNMELSDLTEQTVTDFYDSLQSWGLSARSVWCVHLLLRRCMDEAAREQLIPYNPVRLCREPKTEEYKTAPLRLGQIQRYLNTAEQLSDAEKMAATLANVPEEKRTLVIMMTNSFMAGMEAQKAIDDTAKAAALA